MQKRKSKSQTFLEYAVLIGVLAGALIAMRIYMVRAVQEKYRQSADVFGEGEQYAKGRTQIINLDSRGTNIEETLGSRDPCPGISAEVDKLNREIDGLRSQIISFDEAIATMEPGVSPVKAQATTYRQSAVQKEEQAKGLRAQAASYRQEAAQKDEQAAKNRSDYAYCFGTADESETCVSIVSATTELENQAVALRNQASSNDAQASGLEVEAKDLHQKADSFFASAGAIEAQINAMKKQAEEATAKISEKEQSIASYKAKYQECFKQG